MKRAPTKEIEGHTVLANEAGNRFFHRHLSKKARSQKKRARRAAKASRKRGRR